MTAAKKNKNQRKMIEGLYFEIHSTFAEFVLDGVRLEDAFCMLNRVKEQLKNYLLSSLSMQEEQISIGFAKK